MNERRCLAQRQAARVLWSFALAALAFAPACSDEPAHPAGVLPSTGTETSGGTSSGVAKPLPTQLFDGKSVHSERAAPILGGTLLITRDGATAVLADPDRDRIFFVDLHDLAVSELELEAGDQPGTVLEGPAGRVFVLTRGTGALLSVDVASRALSYRIPVCHSPRGLDYDAKRDSVLVACRSGLVVTFAASDGEVLDSAQFDDDLRDVLVRGDELLLTRARSSEVLVVSSAGVVLRRAAPLGRQASHLFRSLLLPSGELLLAHQTALVLKTLSYVGVGCGWRAVVPTLTLTSTKPPPQGSGAPPGSDPRDELPQLPMGFSSFGVSGVLGPMDIAVSPESGKFALLASGNAWNLSGPGPELLVGPLDAKTGSLSEGFTSTLLGCSFSSKPVAGEPIAVALDARGRVYVQSREPAALVLDNGVQVALSHESRADTGLALFYMNAGGNVACASCHPEGHEDGLTWVGAQFQARRTQSLAGGIASRAPYHWGGEFATLSALMSEVFTGRMGAPLAPSAQQVEALSAWLDQIPAPQIADQLDAAALERGRALFSSAGCDGCHGGSDFSDHALHDPDALGAFRTPSLLAVSARAPYFHDGCAATLLGVFGACGQRSHGSELTAAEKADLVEYLRSL